MNKQMVRVTIEGPKIDTEFKGIWTRALIDAAYRSMLMKLPTHLSVLRSRIIIPNIISEEKLNEREVK